MKCIKGFDVQVLHSPNGFYMGAVDCDGNPICRLSSKHERSREKAKSLVLDRQGDKENIQCNGCGKCF